MTWTILNLSSDCNVLYQLKFSLFLFCTGTLTEQLNFITFYSKHPLYITSSLTSDQLDTEICLLEWQDSLESQVVPELEKKLSLPPSSYHLNT